MVSEPFDVVIITVHDVVHRVTGIITGIMKRVIYLPSAAAELEGIEEGLVHLAGSRGFHKVAGSIDGTQIRIKPPAANKEDFPNSASFPLLSSLYKQIFSLSSSLCYLPRDLDPLRLPRLFGLLSRLRERRRNHHYILVGQVDAD
ncbi:putative nuclease HARBI1 [Xyrichtys novacula]|uniref:Nuclease HARBI1 n=1 Tax=Xyrichtys novacula TaxID=13765 RepID=A0AAV1GS68_XYRNO|nr:putative nuclease HARBI1 [Xyrichtys novacula]